MKEKMELVWVVCFEYMIAYTGSAAQYQCVLLLRLCGSGMFANCLPVCDMWIVEHANADKQGKTAPLQAGSGGVTLMCRFTPGLRQWTFVWHPWSNSALAGMVGELFDRVGRVGEGRTLLYWVCSVSSTCAGWRSTHMATRRSPARRKSWARTTSAWCHVTSRRQTRWTWWVAHLSPPRSTTSTTTSRVCRWAAGAPKAPSSTWRIRTHAMLLPTMAISTRSLGRATSSQTSSSTACHCQRWDTICCALSWILGWAAVGVRGGRKREVWF